MDLLRELRALANDIAKLKELLSEAMLDSAKPSEPKVENVLSPAATTWPGLYPPRF
jgi:hypothetical protein